MASPEQFFDTGYPPKQVFGSASLSGVGTLQASGTRQVFGVVGAPSTPGRSWSDPHVRVELPAVPAARSRGAWSAAKTAAIAVKWALGVAASVATILLALDHFGIL